MKFLEAYFVLYMFFPLGIQKETKFRYFLRCHVFVHSLAKQQKSQIY